MIVKFPQLHIDDQYLVRKRDIRLEWRRVWDGREVGGVDAINADLSDNMMVIWQVFIWPIAASDQTRCQFWRVFIRSIAASDQTRCQFWRVFIRPIAASDQRRCQFWRVFNRNEMETLFARRLLPQHL